MAFRMNRPVIKGTANHKASIAKAKSESIVAQTRTQADSSLVGAAEIFGKSFSPKEIEYGTNMDAFKVPTGDDKTKVGKKKTKKEKTRKENLKEEYEREHPNGTLFPNDSGGYQYYDADGKLVSKKVYDEDGNKVKKQKKSKVEKEKKVKVKKEKGKNIFEKGYKSIKDRIKAKREQNELDFQAKQEEKNRIQAEKDAAYIGKGEQEVAQESYKGSKEELAYLKEQERLAAEAKKKQMRKKEVIEVGPPETTAFGGKQINQYTKEQKERLSKGEAGGNVWSEERERYVLPEEIVDGKFVSKAEGEKVQVLESNKFSGDNQTNKPVVEEKKTLSNLEIRKKRMADKKYNNPKTSQYIKDQMLKEGYVPNESKSPMEMRDNRIYRNAIKGGVVQQNMKKSGYTPE